MGTRRPRAVNQLILRLLGLPVEALDAAEYLARAGDERQQSIGQLARAIAATGDAYHVFGNLPDGHAEQPTGA